MSSINFRGIGKGIISALIILIVLTLLLSLLFYFSSISKATINILMIAALGLSVFLSSALVARGTSDMTLLHGILVSIGIILVLLAISLLVGSSPINGKSVLINLVISIISGGLGGIIGARI